MKELIGKINRLREDPKIASIVKRRMKEFDEKQKNVNSEWFLELCFCLMTANSGAQKVLDICESLGGGPFIDCSAQELSVLLKDNGYRFYNKRAEYIVDAREFSGDLKEKIKSFDNEFEARKWLVDSIKGLGYKEASHLLRNVGYENVAILDRHILRVLHEYGLIDEVPKSLGEKKYYEIEEKMSILAEKSGLSPAELDLYLWYIKTGKVLK
ncbi:MAG: N-glycosylase/DNA lyase [Halobacteriota archaeon]|nr:N-glycosylase/DNA lyase [Halobacteriota archaeon]